MSEHAEEYTVTDTVITIRRRVATIYGNDLPITSASVERCASHPDLVTGPGPRPLRISLCFKNGTVIPANVRAITWSDPSSVAEGFGHMEFCLRMASHRVRIEIDESKGEHYDIASHDGESVIDSLMIDYRFRLSGTYWD